MQFKLLRFVVRFGVMGLLGLPATVALAQTAAKLPLPVITSVRVNSSAPRVGLWNALSVRDRQLAYHLHKAALAGRAILFAQNHRHGLFLKSVFEYSLAQKRIARTKNLLGANGFAEFLAYAAKFQDLGGPYSPSNRKYILTKVTARQVRAVINQYLQYAGIVVLSQTVDEAVRLLTDPAYEVLRQPEDNNDELADTGGNLYEKGITSAEVKAALENGLKIDLNCQIIKKLNPIAIECQRQTVNVGGPVGKALRKVVAELRLALPFAGTVHQKKEIESFIRYFETGDVTEFRQANIEWVQDRTESTVDFMMGFVEVYEDFNGKMGSWESYVQIVDPQTTRMSQALARNAQYFEDQMPYGTFKKQFPADYSPPALMVYYFQEIASMRSGGYNLPNFDDIRRDVGFKNVIRLDLPGMAQDPSTRAVFEEAYKTFMSAELVDIALRFRDKQWQVLVLLHEIIGHGSGTYDISKYGPQEDPISALGAAGGSALEEQRADLAALVFAADPKLVEVGIYKDAAEAIAVRNTMYDTYIASFLLRLSRERTFSESHSRGHWLLVNKLINGGAVEWTGASGQQILKVRDYTAFWTISRDLLAELQRIKAVRDEDGLRNLLAQEAPLTAVNEPWAQSVIQRGATLAYNAGAVEQPWVINSRLRLQTLGATTLKSIAPYW